MATRVSSTIDNIQNPRPVPYLPDSAVIHGSWPKQHGSLRALGHNTLPGFPASGNYPVTT